MSILPSELLTRIQDALARHQEGRALYTAYQEQTGTSRSWRHLDRVEQMAWEEIATGYAAAYDEGRAHGVRQGILLASVISWAEIPVPVETGATDTRAPSPITVTDEITNARCRDCEYNEVGNWNSVKEGAHRHIRHTGHRVHLGQTWTLTGELDLNLPSDSIPS